MLGCDWERPAIGNPPNILSERCPYMHICCLNTVAHAGVHTVCQSALVYRDETTDQDAQVQIQRYTKIVTI